MGYEAICTKKYAKAEMIYRGIVAVTVYQLLKIEAMIGFAIVQYKKDKKPLSWLKTCIKEIPSPFCCDISPFQVSEAFKHLISYFIIASKNCVIEGFVHGLATL